MKDPAKPPVGDNVDFPKLKVLAQPYPKLISGVPDAWSFADDTLTLSYSTKRADGQGAFAAGSLTTIAVPAIGYPKGYQVKVTGGHVVSAPNDANLVVALDAGATTVSVTVGPVAAG